MKHFFQHTLFLLTLAADLWGNSFPHYMLTLRQDDLDLRLSQTEISDFWADTELIQQIGGLHPIPQSLDAFEIISWFNFNQASAAVLPVPLFQLLSEANLLNNQEILAFAEARPASLVVRRKNGSDCPKFSIEQHHFQPGDQISFPNEYHNYGFLLYSSLLRRYPSLGTAEVYYFQDTHDQKAHLKKLASQGGNIFGVFSDDELTDLKTDKELCVLLSGLTTPISGYFLTASQALKVKAPENARWKKLSRNEKNQKIKSIEEYYKKVPVLPKLTYQNIRQRLKDNLGDRHLALAFMGGGARSPYTFRFGNEFFHNILEDLDLSKQAVLLGISGGAINSLLLSTLDPEILIPEHSVDMLANMSRYIQPQGRSEVMSLMVQYPKVFFGVILLILAYLLISLAHLFFTPRHLTAIWKIIILLLTFFGFYWVPSIPIEYAPVSLVILFALQAVIHFLLRHHQPAYRLNLASVTMFLVITAGFVKTPFHQKSLFERFDMSAFMHDFLMDNRQPCASVTNREALSRCLYQRVRYPLVITASNADTLQRVNFFVRPEDSTIVFPDRIDWIDLKNCPERLLDVVEASSSVPMVFRPVEVQCGERHYTLIDGGVLSPLPLVQASELDIHTQFLFWNSLIDVKTDFIGVQALSQSPNIIEQAVYYWTFKIRQSINRGIVKDAFKQTFYISVPKIELIGPGDFWGGHLGNGRFVQPADLSPMATADFFSKSGVFSELSSGAPKPDAFWDHFRVLLTKAQSEQVALPFKTTSWF